MAAQIAHVHHCLAFSLLQAPSAKTAFLHLPVTKAFHCPLCFPGSRLLSVPRPPRALCRRLIWPHRSSQLSWHPTTSPEGQHLALLQSQISLDPASLTPLESWPHVPLHQRSFIVTMVHDPFATGVLVFCPNTHAKPLFLWVTSRSFSPENTNELLHRDPNLFSHPILSGAVKTVQMTQ